MAVGLAHSPPFPARRSMPHVSRGRRPSTKPLHPAATDLDGDAAALWFGDDLSCAVCAGPVAPGSLFCSVECRLRDHQSQPPAPKPTPDIDCANTHAPAHTHTHTLPPPHPRAHTHEPASLLSLHPPLLPPGAHFNALPSPALSATVRRANALLPHSSAVAPQQVVHRARRSIGRRSPEHLSLASDSPNASDDESELPPDTPSPRHGPMRSPTMRFARKPGATNMPAPVVLASPALTVTIRRAPASANTTPASPWMLVDHPSRHSPRHMAHHSHPQPIPEDSDSDAASCISGFDLGPAARDSEPLNLLASGALPASGAPGVVPGVPGASCAVASASAVSSRASSRGRRSTDSIAALRHSLHMASLDGTSSGGQAPVSTHVQAQRHEQERCANTAGMDDTSTERGRARRTSVSRGRPQTAHARATTVRRAASSDVDSRSSVMNEPERGRGRSTARIPRSVSRRRSPSPPRRGDRRASRGKDSDRKYFPGHGPLMPIQPMYAGVEVGALAMSLHSVAAEVSPPRRRSSRTQSHGRATPLTDRSVSRSPCSPAASTSVLGRGRALSLHLIRGSHPPAVRVQPHGC